MFHRNNKQIGTTHLLNSGPTLTQKFIETYKKVSDQYKDGASEEQLYQEAIDILNRERTHKTAAEQAAEEGESVSLSSAFKRAREKQEGGISLKNIFKD